jgi:tetratricopeptide (TPR) repeat protein
VVKSVSDDSPWLNRVVDLRVEDHREPISELKRLYNLRKAYDLANQGDGFLAARDFENAFEAYNAAVAIVPQNDELIFWRGAMLVQSGQESEGLEDIRRAIELNPRWVKLLERIQLEHFPQAREILEKVR